MARHPNNGPSFSKSTIKQKPFAPPSPDRQKGADENARLARENRRFWKLWRDPAAWITEYVGKKK
jgi:hypothetical protein